MEPLAVELWEGGARVGGHAVQATTGHVEGSSVELAAGTPLPTELPHVRFFVAVRVPHDDAAVGTGGCDKIFLDGHGHKDAALLEGSEGRLEVVVVAIAKKA